MDIIIETPKGSRIKYAWEKKPGHYRAKKLLSMGLAFPYDFGFIPGTKGEDGDPLDAFVISEFSSCPGIVVEVRLIGCMRVMQSAGQRMIRNDRYLAVPVISREFENVNKVGSLPPRCLKELSGFMKAYMEAEGKTIEIEEVLDAGDALKILEK